MDININNNGNISQEQVMEAIKRQFEENDKVSYQFNKFLYTEVKEDMLNNSKKVEGALEYDNGRTR